VVKLTIFKEFLKRSLPDAVKQDIAAEKRKPHATAPARAPTILYRTGVPVFEQTKSKARGWKRSRCIWSQMMHPKERCTISTITAEMRIIVYQCAATFTTKEHPGMV
jgi:hypothetical protein